MDHSPLSQGRAVRAEPADGLANCVFTGLLHVYVAFDWGEEIHLDRARQLVPSEVHTLPRRRRTPASIDFRPPPLRFALPAIALHCPELGGLQATAEATVFDFAAVSLAMHLPIQLPSAALSRLAAWLADPRPLVDAAREALQPLHQRLLPTILHPQWDAELSEEYFVFQLPPAEGLPRPESFLADHAGWLAGLVRLEAGPLSPEEIAEALRLSLRYCPDDLLVCDWAAAALFDQDCEETLQTIEFVNLQLLEFRYIDNRLDDSLAAAYGMIHALAQSRLPLLRPYRRSLRVMGELKVDANSLFERTGNVLKLVGDQYLARVYRMVAARFHLEQWAHSIERNLATAESVYRVISDQSDTYRAEFLEVTVVFLILFEIVLALLRH